MIQMLKALLEMQKRRTPIAIKMRATINRRLQQKNLMENKSTTKTNRIEKFDKLARAGCLASQCVTLTTTAAGSTLKIKTVAGTMKTALRITISESTRVKSLQK